MAILRVDFNWANRKEEGPVVLMGLDESYNRILASTARKGESYKCPVCHEDVILKQGQIKIHHFAHWPDSSCVNAGESYRHQEMKTQIGILASSNGLPFDFEVPYNGNRADVVVDERFVVECQESPITYYEIRERTANLRRRYAVGWVFDISRLHNTKNEGEYKIPIEVRQLYEVNSPLNVITDGGNLFRCRLSGVETRYSEWQDVSYYYVPETLRRISSFVKIENIEFDLIMFTRLRDPWGHFYE